jgi:hypothetical protein
MNEQAILIDSPFEFSCKQTFEVCLQDATYFYLEFVMVTLEFSVIYIFDAKT